MKAARKQEQAKQLTPDDWTMAEDNRYGELYRLLISVEYPSDHFNEQVEFVALRDRAIACGMSVDPLPF